MGCPEYKPPIYSRRQVLTLGLEAEYGKSAPEEAVILVRDPVTNYNADVASVAEESDIVDTAIPLSSTWGISGSIWLDGYGNPSNPPSWARLFHACGFPKDESLHDLGYSVYRFSKPTSLTSRHYIGEWQHEARGCYGSFNVSAYAGQPVALDFQLDGLFTKRTRKPTDDLSFPIPTIPPRLINADFSIVLENGDNIVPILQDFRLGVENKREQRFEAYPTHDPSEFYITYPLEATWEVTIEQNYDIDWIEIFREKVRCSLHIRVGQNNGQSWVFKTPTTSAYLFAPPSGGNQGNVLAHRLSFALGGKNMLEIEHR
jgi:hypothetical protein